MKDTILTIIICFLLAAAVFAIVFSMIRSRRKGRSPSCGCGSCSACGACGACPKCCMSRPESGVASAEKK